MSGENLPRPRHPYPIAGPGLLLSARDTASPATLTVGRAAPPASG